MPLAGASETTDVADTKSHFMLVPIDHATIFYEPVYDQI
jgi:hypothetical protein